MDSSRGAAAMASEDGVRRANRGKRRPCRFEAAIWWWGYPAIEQALNPERLSAWEWLRTHRGETAADRYIERSGGDGG